jgi:hypothetical protein
MTSFSDRVRVAAAALAEAERDTVLKRGNVRRFVALNRDLLLELRASAGGWRKVAALLEAEGLRWSNGARVTGAQLRSLVSSVRSTGGATPRAAPAPLFPAQPLVSSPPRPETSARLRLGLSALIDTNGRKR